MSGDRARLVVELVGALFLSIVLTFFFIKDGPQMWSWVTARVRPERRGEVHRSGLEAFTTLRGFVRGVAITGVIDAVAIGPCCSFSTCRWRYRLRC